MPFKANSRRRNDSGRARCLVSCFWHGSLALPHTFSSPRSAMPDRPWSVVVNRLSHTVINHRWRQRWAI